MQNFETQFLLCNLPTAEMIKHANNIFLATSISFANELARVGDGLDVDSHVVATALKQDKRIGPGAYVAPGLGFAGGTLPRDLRVLSQMGRSLKIPTPLVDAVLSVNEMSNDALAQSVLRLLPKGGKVLILGYTYKADTDALRRSPSIELAQKLKPHGVELHGFDPFMNGKDLSTTSSLWKHHDMVEDIPRPDVVILMTTRPQFKELAWPQLAKRWQGDGQINSEERPVVFDTQGFFQSETIVKAGLKYKRLWTSGVQQ
jgi:UDPglucose 6-dehydrogenase